MVTARYAYCYLTQGDSMEDLQEHLRDLYRDLTSGEFPASAGSPSSLFPREA